MAAAARVLSRHAIDRPRRRQIAAPVVLDHFDVALKTARREDHVLAAQREARARAVVETLDADDALTVFRQMIGNGVPTKVDVRVAQGFEKDRPGQVQATPVRHVKAGNAVAVRRPDAIETNAETGEPVPEHFARVVDVEAVPLRVPVNGPVHPIRVGDVRIVLVAELLLERRVDERDAAGLNAVTAENRVHVDDEHARTCPCGIDCSG